MPDTRWVQQSSARIDTDDIVNALLDVVYEERPADLTHFALIRYSDTIKALGGNDDGIIIRMLNGQEFRIKVEEIRH